MKQVEIARFFKVSRTCVADWKRQGAPVDGSMGDVAAWRAARHLGREQAPIGYGELPGLIGGVTRKQEELERRIEKVNAWPADMRAEPGVIKAAVVAACLLERALLGLPARLLNEGRPETVPVDICRIVLQAIDQMKGDEDTPATSPLPAEPRGRKARKGRGGRSMAEENSAPAMPGEGDSK